MPCFCRMRCRCCAPPRRPCRAGCGRGTRPPCTSAPSRRHTEPSSRPITPAPITSRRLGTLGRASAPVEETIVSSSMSMPGSRATSEPVAMTMLLVSSCCLPPPASATSTLPGPEDGGGAVEGVDLVLLEQEGDAVDVALHALVLEGQHLGRSSFGAGTSMPMAAKRVARLLEELGGVQQRLGGDAADVEAGAAVGGALLHHGHLEARAARHGWRTRSRRARCR